MNPGFLTSRSAFFATSSRYQCRAGHGHTLRPARPRLLPFLQLSVKHDRLQWWSLASLFALLLDSLSPGFSLLTFSGGQKWAYGCEYMKYRVFSLYYYLFMIVWFSIRTSVCLLLPSLYNRNTILSVASLGSIFTPQPEKHEARCTLTGVARTLLVTLWMPVVLCNSQSMSHNYAKNLVSWKEKVGGMQHSTSPFISLWGSDYRNVSALLNRSEYRDMFIYRPTNAYISHKAKPKQQGGGQCIEWIHS